MDTATYSPPAWVERVDQVLLIKLRARSWLAQRTGIGYSRLSRIMQGDPRYNFHPYMKKSIADVLEVPESMLFGVDGHD
jgi:hypothetical protein